MAHKAVSLRVVRPVTKSPELDEQLRDYQTATGQYDVIVRYLQAAIEILSEDECQLLLEFAGIEKSHCERLHRDIQKRLAAERKGA